MRLASDVYIAPKVSLERPDSAANMDTYARKAGAGGAQLRDYPRYIHADHGEREGEEL